MMICVDGSIDVYLRSDLDVSVISTSAFAMLGALAWQATGTLIKNKALFLVEREDRTGIFSLLISPGSFSQWSLCPLSCRLALCSESLYSVHNMQYLLHQSHQTTRV